MTAVLRVRPAFTLAELLVVLVVTGIVFAVAGIAVGAGAPKPLSSRDSAIGRTREARAQSLQSGKRATISMRIDGHVVTATVLPDGRVFSDTSLGIETLSGRQR
jgi:putative hemolysin